MTAAPSYSLLPPAPTPYSLFQSVPENFQETDVFHLSQNVDFGKKLGVPGAPVTTRQGEYSDENGNESLCSARIDFYFLLKTFRSMIALF